MNQAWTCVPTLWQYGLSLAWPTDQRARNSDRQLYSITCDWQLCTTVPRAVIGSYVPTTVSTTIPVKCTSSNKAHCPLTALSPLLLLPLLSHQCLTAQLVVQSSSASIPLCSLDIQDPIIFSGFEVKLEPYFGTFDNAFVTFIGGMNG